MTPSLKIFTIGFAHKRAEVFFEALRASGAKRIVDVRLYNTSQLAGFSKKEDLRYFLKQILGMDSVLARSKSCAKVNLEGRQCRTSTEASHFYVDFVFCNYLLKCFVLIDLKVQKLNTAEQSAATVWRSMCPKDAGRND